MCEYCNLVSGNEKDIGEQKNDLLYIVRHNNDFELQAMFDTVEESNEDSRKINYCPMCGRKLYKEGKENVQIL